MNFLKKIIYNIIFRFKFFQRIFFIDEKTLFFNLTFFFKKKQMIKKFKNKKKFQKINLMRLILNKFQILVKKPINFVSILNFFFKLFIEILDKMIFACILLYYFFSFLINLFLLFIKYFYNKYLKLKLSFLKLSYNFFEIFGFKYFFLFYYFFYYCYVFLMIIFVSSAFFYIFKTNYFDTDYFYINYYRYDNNFQTEFLSSKKLYYHRFSLWWIFRIYLLYLLLYIFVKDVRGLIRDNLLFIIFLPIVICNFNFRFYILLMLGWFFDTLGGLKINKDSLFLKKFRKKTITKPFSLSYLNNKFNFLFSNSLKNEFRRIKILQSSTNTDLQILNNTNLNLRDESNSYKNEILRIKKLKVIQDYYLDFKIIDKKNKILNQIHTDLINDKKLTKKNRGAKSFYHKFNYYSNFYTLQKKNDTLNVLNQPKYSSNFIPISPHLDINAITNAPNRFEFERKNNWKNQFNYKKKLAQIYKPNQILPSETFGFPSHVEKYNRIGYTYDLIYEINNRKLKKRAEELILKSKFENAIDSVNKLDSELDLEDNYEQDEDYLEIEEDEEPVLEVEPFKPKTGTFSDFDKNNLSRRFKDM